MAGLFGGQGDSAPSSTPITRSWAEEFARSALSSATSEMVGLNPWSGVQDWRQESPYAGVVSQIAPLIGVYGAGIKLGTKALAKTPVLSNWWNWARAPETIASMPVVSAAAEGALAITPLSLARLGGAAIAEGFTLDDPSQQPLTNTIPSVALDYAIGAGVDVGLRLLKGGAKVVGDLEGHRQKLFNIPGTDVNADARVLLKELSEINVPADQAIQVKRGLEGEILAEAKSVPATKYFEDVRPPAKVAFGPFLDDPNTLIGPRKFQLINPESDYQSIVDSVIKASGSSELNPNSFWQHITKPLFSDTVHLIGKDGKRVADSAVADPFLSVEKSQLAHSRMVERLNKTLGPAAEDQGLSTWYRQSENGLFTIVKELPQGKFFMAQTDRPSLFMPKSSFTETNMAKGGLMHTWTEVEKSLVAGSPSMRAMDDITNTILSAPVVSAKGSWIDTALKAAPDGAQEELRRLWTKVGGEVTRLAAPTTTHLARNPLAQRLFGAAKMYATQGVERATSFIHGTARTADRSRSAAYTLLHSKGVVREGGLSDLISKFTPQETLDFVEGLYREMPLESIAVMPYSANVKEALRRNAEYFRGIADELKGMNRLDGAVSYLDNYQGSHIWRGGFRAQVKDAEGRTIAVGSGHTGALAVEDAQKLAKALNDEGIVARADAKAFVKETGGKFSDEALERLLPIGTPEHKAVINYRLQELDQLRRQYFEKTRTGMRGFETDPLRKRLWDNNEIIDMLAKQAFARERLRADTAFKLHPQVVRSMSRLQTFDPQTYKFLDEKLNALAGQPTGVFAFVDKYANQVLGRWLGPDGATKIARAVNRSMYTLTFGLPDIAFPVLNALTGVQTVIPEIAYVLNHARHSPETLAKYYMAQPLINGKGIVTGGMHALDPLKLFASGWRTMFSKDAPALYKAHVEEAMRQGVVAPRLFEETAGKKFESAMAVFRSKDPKEFAESLLAINEYLPGQSDKLARLQAFTTAWNMGKDLLGLTDDGLYLFAKDFTDKTMYLYGAADRPALFGGAFGSTYGLFKTWMVNFVSNMMSYGKDATLHGNFAPLLWMNASTAMFAGAVATPAFALVDGISSIFMEDKLSETLRKEFGYSETAQDLVDVMFYGMPSLLNISLTSRASLPGSDPLRDISQLGTFAFASRAASLGMAAGEAIDHFQTTGQFPFQDPRVRQLMANAVLPRSFAKASNVIEGNLTSASTGNTIIPNVGFAEELSNFLGFTPLDWQKGYELTAILHKKNEAMRAQVRSMGEALESARASQDWQTYNAVAKQAMTLGIWDRVYQSAATRGTKRQEGLEERLLAPGKEQELRAAFGSR